MYKSQIMKTQQTSMRRDLLWSLICPRIRSAKCQDVKYFNLSPSVARITKKYLFGVCGNVEAAEVPGRFVVQIFRLYSVHRSLVANTVNLFFIPLKTIDVSLSSSP